MIFAVPSDPESPRLDRWKAQADCLSQRGSVHVRDSIMVADTAIGRIESLARDISVRVRGVVCVEPGKGARGLSQRREGKRDYRPAGNLPSMDENLLCTVRSTSRGGTANIGSKLFEIMIGVDSESVVGLMVLDGLHWINVGYARMDIHVVIRVIGRVHVMGTECGVLRGREEHLKVFCLTRRRVDV